MLNTVKPSSAEIIKLPSFSFSQTTIVCPLLIIFYRKDGSQAPNGYNDSSLNDYILYIKTKH